MNPLHSSDESLFNNRLVAIGYLLLHLPQPSHHARILGKLLASCFRAVFVCSWCSSADYLIHSADQETGNRAGQKTVRNWTVKDLTGSNFRHTWKGSEVRVRGLTLTGDS